VSLDESVHAEKNLVSQGTRQLEVGCRLTCFHGEGRVEADDDGDNGEDYGRDDPSKRVPVEDFMGLLPLLGLGP
jgi:hypothetical protein